MTQFENLKLKNQLCFALYAATSAITRAYRTKLIKVGLTYTQYLVLMVLWEKDGLSVKDIAKELHLDSATITPLLKRLETEGFVTRERSLIDERIVNVFLTNHGRDIQSQVAEMQKGIACQTGLLDDQFIELRSSLHELIDNININQPELEVAA